MDTNRGFQLSQQWKQCLAALGVSAGISSWGMFVIWLSLEPNVLSNWISTLVMIIGSMVGAVSADTFGRKRTLLVMLVMILLQLFLGGYTLIMSHYDYGFSITLIILLAFIIGATSTVVPVYLSEIAGTNIREILMLMPLPGFCIAMIIALLVYINQPTDLLTTYLVGCLAVVMMLFHGVVLITCPETPYYLNWKGKHDEAENSLKFYTKSDYLRVPEDVSKLNEKQNADGFLLEWKLKMKELVRKENLRRLAIVFSLIIIKWVIGGRQNFDIVDELMYCTTDPLFFLILIPMLMFSIFFILCVNLFKKKPALLVAIAFSFASTVIDIIFPGLPIIVVCLKFLCHAILVAVILAQVGNLFPTNVKAVAIAIVTSFQLLTRNLYDLIEGTLLYGYGSYHHIHWEVKSYVDAALIVVIFILALTLYPKSTEAFSAKTSEHYSTRTTGPLVFRCDKTGLESGVVTCEIKR
ncbi:solute carrier family 2, facilitated glucose transporter member 2-like [Diprion similis]|uniref:solute carrier family 2, facilitated glucose transporter member 2-like n=1 Tax=Diprion similis TaxID=362088 RepID=UPI001EF7F913|nr:solute carrier family 2, facilitated glucose transporter member 2-like [Diprion similis]